MRRAAAHLAHMVIVLFLVTLAVSAMIDLTPGDPAYAILGEQATPAEVTRVHAELHLDDPFYLRYWHWLDGVRHGDLGRSYQTGQSVLGAIGQRLPVTLETVLLALLLALASALVLGTWTAVRAGGLIDRVWAVLSAALVSVPVFVTGLLLVFVFSLRLRGSPLQLPATGWVRPADGLGDNLRHAVLPALALALAELPVFARLLRADLVRTLGEDHILAAQAQGVPTSGIVLHHALRLSSFPLLTMAGLSLGRLIGGAVVIESLFALPGIGQLLVLSVEAKDVVVVQGVVAVVAVGYVLVNTAVDGLYGLLDPRVRAAAR